MDADLHNTSNTNTMPLFYLYDGENGTGNILLSSSVFGDYSYDSFFVSINDKTKSVEVVGDAILTLYQHYITDDLSEQISYGEGIHNIPETWMVDGLGVSSANFEELSEIIGTDARDTLVGTEFSDIIFGEGGNDEIRAGAFNDTIYGGDGNDKVWGDAGDDIIRGGYGNDKMYGGEGADTFIISGGRRNVIYDFNLEESDKIQMDPTDIKDLRSNRRGTSIIFSNNAKLMLPGITPYDLIMSNNFLA